MTKAEFIQKVAKNTRYTQYQVEKVISEAFQLIQAEVRKGEVIKIAGFGTFEKQKHKSRKIKTPQKDTCIEIPSMWYPKFRPSEYFKNFIR